MKFFTVYEGVPEELVQAVSQAGVAAADYGCPADASDCSTDGACTSDGVCSTDQPCSDCSDNPTPCSDCSDTPKTYLPAGRITGTSSTDTTITMRFASISGAVGYQVAIRMASVSGGAIEYNIGNRTSYTFTGLTPDTEYVINYCGIDSDGDRGYYITPSGPTVTTLPARPKYWSWANGLVTSKPAVGALSSGDDIPEYLSAAGWTLFVQNIKDVYKYRIGTSYSGSLSDGGNGTKKLSAAMVNQAITAIRTMTSTYLPGQTTSDTTKLSASLLNGLADSLNSII